MNAKKQLASNIIKLLDAYRRTHDDNLLEIIRGLLEALVEELDDQDVRIKRDPNRYPVPQCPAPQKPTLAPTVVMYGAFMDDVAYDANELGDATVKEGLDFVDGDATASTDTFTCCCRQSEKKD